MRSRRWRLGERPCSEGRPTYWELWSGHSSSSWSAIRYWPTVSRMRRRKSSKQQSLSVRCSSSAEEMLNETTTATRRGQDGEVNQPKQRHRGPDGSDHFRIASLRPFPGRL